MEEKLFFENSKGNKLCGVLSNPTLDIDKPIIILCHGFSTSKNGKTYLRLEKILNEHGISTFRFDFFGHGESEGEFEDVTTSEAIDDVQNAINYLKETSYEKIGLFGSSFGGLASIIASSKTNDLYILALKSPVSDYLDKTISREVRQQIETWKEKGFMDITSPDGEKRKLNYSFIEDAKNFNGYESARKIRVLTLIVHGDKDETVPVRQSIKTASLIENCRLEIIKGGDHTYSIAENFEKMLELISTFIIENS